MTARVLIVDDTEANSRILSLAVTREYYEVMTATRGAEAIELASSWRPDVIILDVMMPEMDGYETCQRLKANEHTAHIPVVMVTALDGASAKLRGLEYGADDFLTRPIDYGTMLARVRNLVRLKRLFDEWRARWETTRSLGLIAERPMDVTITDCKALLVDDWDLGAERLESVLAEEGIVTLRARSEEQARAIVEVKSLDLVVINLSMGTSDPLRLASRLRADEISRDVPLLLIADVDHRDAIVRGFDLGANDWIMRPIDANELRVRARNQIRRKLYQDRLRDDLDRALRLALVDPLTGLYNRRYFQRHLEGVLKARPFASVAVLMIDIDRFKTVNDRFGHPAGDRVLERFGRLLQRETRIVDLVARLGGEEFAIVMAGMEIDEVLVVAERLRAALADIDFEFDCEGSYPLTISIGVALSGDPDADVDRLINAADEALYAAKAGGRNRVELAELPPR